MELLVYLRGCGFVALALDLSFDLDLCWVNYRISSICLSGGGVCTGGCISSGGHAYSFASRWVFLRCCLSSSTTLTLNLGLKSNTISLYRSDIAHHHFALGIVISSAHHVYHRLTQDLQLIQQTQDLLQQQSMFLHQQLSLALHTQSIITAFSGQHICSANMSPYFYLPYDSMRTSALYVHHSWIASFLICGSFAHQSINLLSDLPYHITTSYNKHSILSGVLWCSLWLGFHTTLLFIHNDTFIALNSQSKQILIQPVFAQIPKSTHHPGPGDLLAHHAIALGLHISSLIIYKGCLDARGSKLMPDKIIFGLPFACDGPGRGGTCDISAWDSFYLATFWMLNSNAWIIFYFHWKHNTLWQSAVFQFDECSTYLNGWFRDYLWFNSTALIHGYNTFGANDLSTSAWTFLLAHLIWATGFMFLISWRGYWQELINILLSMHLKTPIASNLYTQFNIVLSQPNQSHQSPVPVALSIVQARFQGLVHFVKGFILTYAAFIIGATT